MENVTRPVINVFDNSKSSIAALNNTSCIFQNHATYP